jgi:hypothetical protein
MIEAFAGAGAVETTLDPAIRRSAVEADREMASDMASGPLCGPLSGWLEQQRA